MSRPLRIQADDPMVLAHTGEALQASQRLCKPSLEYRCKECGPLLAQAGYVPGYGPLFVSSWTVDPPDQHAVFDDGRELRGREKQRWLAEYYETVEESGVPVVPLVVA